jgi:competence protein ComEA
MPATAQAIITHRDQNGPFPTVDALADVPGIGPAKLDALRPLVMV